MEFQRARSAGYQANHLARLFAAGLQARIKSLGISPGQFPMLVYLWDRDGVTQRELVDAVDIEQATMANTLNRMERDGLIRRSPHPEDGRAKIIHLTEAAKAIREPALAAAQEVNRLALDGLTVQERDTYLRLSAKLIANLQADGA